MTTFLFLLAGSLVFCAGFVLGAFWATRKEVAFRDAVSVRPGQAGYDAHGTYSEKDYEEGN